MVPKLILGAIALVGLAVAGVGIYKMIVGDNGGLIVMCGVVLMLIIAASYESDKK